MRLIKFTLKTVLLCALVTCMMFVGHLGWLGFKRGADFVESKVVGTAQALAMDRGWSPPEPSVDECIAMASDKYSVHENRIRAVIEVESNWNPTAVSPAGALGLMQLMPASAKRFGYEPSEMLTSPCKNVFAGVAHLAADMVASHERFNGGPKCVGGKCKESREYARKVLAALND